MNRKIRQPHWRRCACPLCSHRSFGVPGEGPIDSHIMIIGEAPGASENNSGKPFYGRSGKLLNDMLASAGISRGDCYVTNVVKCWPGEGNPDPTPEAVDACSHWLEKQIQMIKPRGIITLGQHSTKLVTGVDEKIGKVQGSVNIKQGVYVMPLYHPAYLLRNHEERPFTQGHLDKFKEIIYGSHK